MKCKIRNAMIQEEMRNLQHLLPIQANKILIRLCDACLPLSPLVVGQQAGKIDVAILKNHVDQLLFLDKLQITPKHRGSFLLSYWCMGSKEINHQMAVSTGHLTLSIHRTFL